MHQYNCWKTATSRSNTPNLKPSATANQKAESAQQPITAKLVLVSFVSAMNLRLQMTDFFQRFWLWKGVFDKDKVILLCLGDVI